MDEIIDNYGAYPVANAGTRITTQHVRVNMAGMNGFQAVTNGNTRAGVARIAGNAYNIRLPGVAGGTGFTVEFRRI